MLNRTIQWGTTSNSQKTIEVATGKTLQVNAPFDFTGVPLIVHGTPPAADKPDTASNLTKNDNGILVINASIPTWVGQITINGGAVRATMSDALGSWAI